MGQPSCSHWSLSSSFIGKRLTCTKIVSKMNFLALIAHFWPCFNKIKFLLLYWIRPYARPAQATLTQRCSENLNTKNHRASILPFTPHHHHHLHAQTSFPSYSRLPPLYRLRRRLRARMVLVRRH